MDFFEWLCRYCPCLRRVEAQGGCKGGEAKDYLIWYDTKQP